MLAVAPYLGGNAAVSLELPVILVISWIACRWVVGRHSVPPTWNARLTMGGFAFVLLMVAEMAFGELLLGRTMDEHFATYRTFEGSVGLVGQIIFASFPIVEMKRQ